MSFSLLTDDPDKQQAQTEVEIAAIFDGTISLIASIRCYGFGTGTHHRRCFHHLNLYPASPTEPITLTQAKAFARKRGWQRKQRDGLLVWLCPDCL
jgi:hypothetical protein